MTLIELMLAIVLSILIINSIFEIYYIAEKNSFTQNALITLQEDAQAASQILKRQVRESTYFGCAKLTDGFPFINHTSLLLNLKNKITSYQNDDIKPGTDAIQFWNAGIENAVLAKTMHGYTVLYVTANLHISINDILMISDCKTAEIFAVKSVALLNNGTQKILTSKPLNKLYSIHAEVNKLVINAYYIGKNDKLFIRDIQGNTSELAENISQMKIFFYVKADDGLIKHSINELNNFTDINNISFELTLEGKLNAEFHKKWNIYVALS